MTADNYTIVPKDPTQFMCQDGQVKAREWPKFPLRIAPIYEAMLAAAPATHNLTLIDRDELEALRRDRKLMIESVAKAIYMQWWAYSKGYTPWVDGGNSMKQDEARFIAVQAISASKGEQL